MADTLSPEPKKNAVPALLAVVILVAAVAAGGLFMMTSSSVADSKAVKTGKKAEASAAQEATFEIKPGDPVVAVVDGESIMRSEILAFINGLPEQVRQMPIQNLFPMARDQIVNNRVVSARAKVTKLEEDPEVKKHVEQATSQIVRGVYMEREVAAAISQKEILKAYDELLTQTEKIQETKARHILVDTEEKAREAIGKLDGGAKFEDLVKEYSSGPSKDNGGDLGYFAKTEILPEVGEVGFSLDVGKYTKDPVKTQFGWHVIIVDDRRQRAEPKFEDVKPQLEAGLRQKKVTELLQKWEKEAKIEKFDINGEKDKEAGNN